MRAAFLDPKGPAIWRATPWLIPLLVMTTGLFGPWSGHIALELVMAGFLSLNLAGLVPIRQRRRQEVELQCGPGYVIVRGGAWRMQRIDARSIVGGSTARTRGGIVLSLSLADRTSPLVLEVDSEADADRLRRSLGIGHDGFGTIGWRGCSSDGARTGHVGRMSSLAITALIGLALASGIQPLFVLTAIFGGLAAFVATIVGLVGPRTITDEPSVLMTPNGLRLRTPRGWFQLPYADVTNVVVQEKVIRFELPPPHHELVVAREARPWAGEGLTDDEAAALVAQIKTAAGRARGLGPRKPDLGARLEVLRRQGETPRAWLARLDIAGRMLADGSGYRSQPLDVEDLWTVLEDPDGDAELRMAAARVLRSSGQPDAKLRIDTAAAAVRDEDARRKLRIAAEDDVEQATAALGESDFAERHPPIVGGNRGTHR